MVPSVTDHCSNPSAFSVSASCLKSQTKLSHNLRFRGHFSTASGTESKFSLQLSFFDSPQLHPRLFSPYSKSLMASVSNLILFEHCFGSNYLEAS